MTGNRILYFYFLLASFSFFVLFDQYVFHLFFLFVVLLPALSLLQAVFARRAVRCKMALEDDIVPKGRCELRLTAENRAPFPCACIRIHLAYRNALGRIGGDETEMNEEIVQFPLAPRRAYTFQTTLKNAACGRIDFSIRKVEICDMLRLFRIPTPNKFFRGEAGSVYVLPEPQSRMIQTDDAADLGIDSTTYSTEKPGGDPSEIFQLRDYREGDAQHSIHWKLSSRMQRLIVREYGLPLNPSMHFLLELRAGAEPEMAEAMLGTMLAFSEYLQVREVVHGISWLDGESVLRTVAVTDTDALAAALHDLLAMPGQKPWSALQRFAVQPEKQPDMHLVYLVAGADETKDANAEAEQLLGNLIDLGLCRRMTMMLDRCSETAAQHFCELGCEVQRLDGSIPGAEAEE